MFERCEEALLKSINITSCAEVHRDAKVTGATALLDSCNQMIARYWNNLPKQELDLPKMDVDSLCETAKVNMFTIISTRQRNIRRSFLLFIWDFILYSGFL